MIQRIQTIYLVLSAIFTAFFAFSVLATMVNSDSTYHLTAFGLNNVTQTTPTEIINTVWFGMFSWLLVGLQFGIIFLYKSRVRQMRLAILSALINLGLIGLAYYICLGAQILVHGSISYNVVAIFPLISAIFLGLAVIGIKKDENLIKSLNRIR